MHTIYNIFETYIYEQTEHSRTLKTFYQGQLQLYLVIQCIQFRHLHNFNLTVRFWYKKALDQK